MMFKGLCTLPFLVTLVRAAVTAISTATTITAATLLQSSTDSYLIETGGVLEFTNAADVRFQRGFNVYGDVILHSQQQTLLAIYSSTFEDGSSLKYDATGTGMVSFFSAGGMNNHGDILVTSQDAFIDATISGFGDIITNTGSIVIHSFGAVNGYFSANINNTGIFTVMGEKSASFGIHGPITNTGTMTFYGNSTSDSIYWGSTFTNSGTFLWQYNEYASGSSHALEHVQPVTNTGTINVFGSAGTSPLIYYSPLQNDGSICLRHTGYSSTSSLTGTGCFLAYDSSALTFNYASGIPETQNIVIDSTSHIYISSMSSNGAVYPLYGVSNGMTFLTYTGYLPISVSYDDTQGYLTLLASSSLFVVYDIGYGYSLDGFSVTDNEVTYLGSDPESRGIPTFCVCSSRISAWERSESSSVSSLSLVGDSSSLEESSSTVEVTSTLEEHSSSTAVISSSLELSSSLNLSPLGESSSSAPFSDHSSSYSDTSSISTSSFEVSQSESATHISLQSSTVDVSQGSSVYLSESSDHSTIITRTSSEVLSSFSGSFSTFVPTSSAGYWNNTLKSISSLSSSIIEYESSSHDIIICRPGEEGCILASYTNTEADSSTSTSLTGTLYTDKEATNSNHLAIATICPECTRYLSTWTTTITAGVTTTVCGEVVVTSDTQGSLITSLFPSNQNEKTVTFSTTDHSGLTITVCGIEKLTTNTSGDVQIATLSISKLTEGSGIKAWTETLTSMKSQNVLISTIGSPAKRITYTTSSETVPAVFQSVIPGDASSVGAASPLLLGLISFILF
ncbi:CIC11C00000002955 [Sungouiella intermedia]|uniref:CIC11C00000002955 n=1 Tax=Sungouiella intermedia TaxID=45354 RepID=A0A1L0DJB4_9ASCO|nr:CIC11C00000002955 [[Candida] intermedia]